MSAPSSDTVNIVLNESTITSMEKPEALDKWTVAPRQQGKRKDPDSVKQICDKKLKKSPVHEDEFFILSEAFQECNDISNDEIDVVLLLPENVDGDTDNECGNDTEVTDISLGMIKEVTGTIEINTSCKMTKTKRKNIKDVKNHKPLSGYRKKVEKEKERVKTMQDKEENFDLKMDSLVSRAETLDGLRNWKATTNNNENKGLQWKTEMSYTTDRTLTNYVMLAMGKCQWKFLRCFSTMKSGSTS